MRVWTGFAFVLAATVSWPDDASPSGDGDDAPRVALRGTVTDAQGEPLDAFVLIVFRRDAEPEVVRFRRAGGSFEAEADAMVYGAAIDAGGHAPWFAVVRFNSGGSHDFGVVSLPRERVVEGRIVASATGVPIAGAGIRYVPLAALYLPHVPMGHALPEGVERWAASSTVSDEEGRFTLRRLPYHEVGVNVSASGHAGRAVALPAGVERLDIELWVGATIEGALSLPSGDAVEGTVTLTARQPWRGAGPRVRQVDSRGRFRFEHIEPGSYHLGARTVAGVVEGRTVTVAGNARVVADLPVDPLGRLVGYVDGLRETERARISVWRPGGGAGGHVKSPLWRPEGVGERVRAARDPVDNGPFELSGISDGTYVVEAKVGHTSMERRVSVVDGVASVRFDFALGGTRLTGRVLAGGRPLPGYRLELVPRDDELPFAGTMTDQQGRYAIDRLADGDYQVVVKLGSRGTYRTFDVTLAGATTFDVRLGPYRLSGEVLGDRIPAAPGAPLQGSAAFTNHVVQARLLDRHDEPTAFREFVDSRGMYAFDGLEEGRYAVSHVSPYYDGMREIAVFGGSLDGVDIEPVPSGTRLARFADAESGAELASAQCEVEEGAWVGTILYLGQGRGLPTTLADTDMTCSSAGHVPVRFRWDGGPLHLDLEPDTGSAKDDVEGAPGQRTRGSGGPDHEIFTPAHR